MLKTISKKQPISKALGNYLQPTYGLKETVMNSLIFMAYMYLLALCMYPDISLAASLEGQLDTVATLSNGKLKAVGISGSVIVGIIIALVRGSLKLLFIILGIGVLGALYLEWVNSGMRIMT